MVGILLHGGQLAVRLGHEGLQLFLEQLIRGLGSRGLNRGPLRTVLALILEAAFPPGGVAAPEIVGTAGILALGLGLQTLDGQVDLAVLGTDDYYLDLLTLGQVLADVTDIGVGHLGNMYQTGLVLRQGDECAEIGDGLDFAF